VDIEFTVEEPEPKQDEFAEDGENGEGIDADGSVAVEELPLQAKPVTAGEESA